MKESEDTLTVIVFRGARANPWRLKIRKAFVKYGLMSGLVLLLIQGGIVTHYVYQWNQLIELEGIKQELNLTRAKTTTFSTEVDGMKKRMLALENLNRKLQTMFGLEPDEIQGLPSDLAGQGGQELPYEGLQDEAEFQPIDSNARVSSMDMTDGLSASNFFNNFFLPLGTIVVSDKMPLNITPFFIFLTKGSTKSKGISDETL